MTRESPVHRTGLSEWLTGKGEKLPQRHPIFAQEEEADRFPGGDLAGHRGSLPEQTFGVFKPSVAVIAGNKNPCPPGNGSRQDKGVSIQRSSHCVFTADGAKSGGIIVPRRVHITVHIAVAADGAGMGGITLLRTGGGSDGGCIIMLRRQNIQSRFFLEEAAKILVYSGSSER